jgi:hypothetical protein
LEDILSRSLLKGIRDEAANSPEIIKRQQDINDINADRLRMAMEQAFLSIFRVPVNGKVAIDNQANRSVILAWLHEDQGEQLSPAWFKKVLKETPSLAKSLAWQSADVLDPKKRQQAAEAQAEQDRETFNQFAREYGFSEVEANYLLAKSVLGSGFTVYQLSESVSSNAISLAQASPEELEQFRQEKIENHNAYLRSLDIPTLRKLAREAGARGPATSQPDETQRIRAAERVDGTYPSLPDEFRDGNNPEEVLDAAFIRKCSKETLRLLLKRYGADQVNEALRTRVGGIYQY